MDKIMHLQRSTRDLLSWFLSPDSKVITNDEPHVLLMFARQIGSSYEAFDSVESRGINYTVTSRKFDSRLYSANDRKYVDHLMELKHCVDVKFRPFLTHFFLHGSYATRDYSPGWSDVDTLMIISSETLKSPHALVELRSLCQTAYEILLKIDPLQHHGFIVATEYDLKAYPASFLPLEILHQSVSLIDGREHLIACVIDSREEIRKKIFSCHSYFESAVKNGVFRHHAYQGEYLKTAYTNAENSMYQFKYFLALLMSLPALYLSAIGKSCYKKDSFTICKDFFEDGWSIIEEATEVRRRWPLEETSSFEGNAIPDWVQKIVTKNYFSSALKFSSSIIRKLNNES